MKPLPKVILRILDAIREARTFCVIGHVRPDGDCVGSQLGLAMALRNAGKEVACWNEDPLPAKLAFLDNEKLFSRPAKEGVFDCVIALDAASAERLGSAARCLEQRRVVINIDHHRSNTRFGDINWVSPREPSTGELVFRLLKAAKWPITEPIASCLFTAISTDTGSFQYASTRPNTYQVAGELVRRGADLARISNEVYQSYPLCRVRLLSRVYQRYRLTHHNQIAYFWLRQEDYGRTGSEPSDSEGLIDHIRAIEPVIVACVFEEMEPDLTRVSLRSKSEAIHVNEVAALFGGGGHVAAAGARVRGNPRTVQRQVIAAIKQALNRQKSA